MEEDGDECDEGAEELAGELDPRICGGHGALSHAEGFFSKEVIPEPWAGEGHFDEAGEEGEDEKSAWKRAEIKEDEAEADEAVKEEPEGGVER